MSDEDYARVSFDAVPARDDRPASRHELSPALGIEGYNLNVTDVEPGERHPLTGLHFHGEQEEVFLAMAGRCRVELRDGSIDVGPREAIAFRPATAHCIHNPFDERCTLVAIGHPPEAHQPSTQVQSFPELIDERYGEGDP